MARSQLLSSLSLIVLLTACDSDGSTSDSTSTTGGSTSSSSTATSTTSLSTTGGTGSTTSAAEDTGSSTGPGDSTGDTGTTGFAGSTGTAGSTETTSTTGDQTSEACFEGGGTAPAPAGAGTCASPWVLDLSAEAHGTIVSLDLSGGADEMDMAGGGTCLAAPENTARDIVVHVLMPGDVTGLLISVNPTSGADPRIAVAEDPSCFQPMNACADELGDDACEGLLAPRGGDGFFGVSTYVVISELVDSGETLTVRFQTTAD